MIFLVLTFPFFTSLSAQPVSAVTNHVLDTEVVGEDGIDGFVRVEDVLVFTTYLTEPIDDPSLLKVVVGSKSMPFQSCSGTSCTLQFPKPRGTGSYSYRVELYDESNQLVSSSPFPEKFVVDNKPPLIDSFSLDKNLLSGSQILKIDYQLKDYAFGTVDGAGLNRVELRAGGLGGDLLAEQVWDPALNKDSVDGQFSLSGDDISSEDREEVVLYLIVYDNFNQVSHQTEAVTIDSIGPSIDEESFQLLVSGQESEFIRQDSPASLNVEVSADAQLVEGIIIQDDNVIKTGPAVCRTVGTLKSCSWDFRVVLPSDEHRIDIDIEVNASDELGNFNLAEESFDLEIDQQGPEIKKIETPFRLKDDKYGAGQVTTYVVEVDDKGAGFNASDIVLDFSALNPSLGEKAADSCDRNDCFFYNITATEEGEQILRVSPQTQDSIGNPVDTANSVMEQVIVLDLTPPQVESVSLNSRRSDTPQLIKTGDKVEIFANVTEPSELSAVANLSVIITGRGAEDRGSCKRVKVGGEETDMWECEWTTKAIDKSGFISDYVYLTFVDAVGNEEVWPQEIVVLGLRDEPDPNYWTSTYTCSPRLVDRQVAELIEQKVYCAVQLHPTTSAFNLTPISVEIDGCEGDDARYLDDEEVVNGLGSRNPFLYFVLDEREIDVTSYENISCPLLITTQVGNEILVNQEIEKINLSIQFYNYPLGEYSDKVADEIDSVKDVWVDGWGKWIGTLNKILKIANSICRTMNLFRMMGELFESLDLPLRKSEVAAMGTPAEPPIEAARLAAETSAESQLTARKGLEQSLSKFCDFINCKYDPSQKDGWTEQTGWLEKTGGLLGGAGGMDLNKMFGSDWVKDFSGKNPEEYMNAHDNIIVAMLQLCIPGIIFNLEKYRQIQCVYAYCLQEASVKHGVPISACEAQKSYASCKYILGAIFRAIPIVAFFDYYINYFREILSDPMRLVGFTLSYTCYPEISAGNPESWSLCRITEVLNSAFLVFKEVSSIITDWKTEGDFCKKID